MNGIITIVYGMLMALGGVMGYVKAQSKASLIAGCVSGVLLILAGMMTRFSFAVGPLFAKALTVGLVLVFALRLLDTGKFMPSGMMLISSVFVLILLFITK